MLMKNYIETVTACIQQAEPNWNDAVGAVIRMFLSAKKDGGTIYFIGNGGSAGIAVHMAADFQKAGGFRTRTFYDPSLITCMGNDYGYEYVFSRPLKIYAQPCDVLTAISSSGNSANILNATDVVKEHGCRIVTLSGFAPNNMLRAKGDVNLYIPSYRYGIVESLHNLFLQQVMDEIEDGRME